MRISTSQVFDRATRTMGSLTVAADKLQTQIATGKKLSAASDDAVAYRQLTGLRRMTANEKQDASNLALASSLLSASDGALDGVEALLQRANELAIQARTDTMPLAQKAVIAQQIDAIREDVLRLANATDARGSPLFSGSSEAAPYTQASDGSVSYSGVGEAAPIPLGDGSIQATTSGARIFGSILVPGGTTDVFRILGDLSAGLRAGTDTGTSITDVRSALASLSDARASIGARGARVDLETARMADVALNREETRVALEDTDITVAVTELQKTLTVLSATQASFGKLSSLSLFDYLR